MNGLQAFGNLSKNYLVDYTKVLNIDANPGAVDIFMDSIRGRGHRVVFGHDLTTISEIYEKFGLGGIADYFKHIAKDIMSPDGIPVPFAKEIKGALGLSTKNSIDWFCFNIGDVLSGGLSIFHSWMLYQTLSTGAVTEAMVLQIVLGSGIKVVSSIWCPNPISFLSGLFDFGLIAYYGYPICSGFVQSILSDEMSLEVIAGNSLQAVGYGFCISLIFEGLGKIKEIKNGEISIKQYVSRTLKKASLNGLISGCSSMASDMSEKYFHASSSSSIAIGVTTFAGLKYFSNRISSKKKIANMDFMINFDVLPAYN